MPNQNYSFVIRVWQDSTASDNEIAIWRGSIEQVGSDCRFYFSDLDGITRFIRTQIGVQANPAQTGWRLALVHIQNGIRKLSERLFH